MHTSLGRLSNPFSHGEKEGPAPAEAWEDEGVRSRRRDRKPSPSRPLRGRAPPSPKGDLCKRLMRRPMDRDSLGILIPLGGIDGGGTAELGRSSDGPSVGGERA